MKTQKLLADKRIDYEFKTNKFKNLNEKLEQRRNSMKLKLEKRDKLRNELLNFNVDEQTKELNHFKNKLAEAKRSLNDVVLTCEENDKIINVKSQEVHETKVHLNTIKDEYDYSHY